MEVQSILFAKKGKYDTKAKQEKWMKENGFKIMKNKKIHETSNFSRHRLFEPDTNKDHKLKKFSENIYAVMEFPKKKEAGAKDYYDDDDKNKADDDDKNKVDDDAEPIYNQDRINKKKEDEKKAKIQKAYEEYLEKNENKIIERAKKLSERIPPTEILDYKYKMYNPETQQANPRGLLVPNPSNVPDSIAQAKAKRNKKTGKGKPNPQAKKILKMIIQQDYKKSTLASIKNDENAIIGLLKQLRKEQSKSKTDAQHELFEDMISLVKNAVNKKQSI